MEALGIGPGPEVGRVLATLLDRVLDEPALNTRVALLRITSELAPGPSTGNPQRS
jgi:hypothetical protein